MRWNRTLFFSLTIIIALGVVAQSGCANSEAGKGEVAANPAGNTAAGKIPVTTTSLTLNIKTFLQL